MHSGRLTPNQLQLAFTTLLPVLAGAAPLLPANDGEISQELPLAGWDFGKTLEGTGETNQSIPWTLPVLESRDDPRHVYTRTYTSYLCLDEHPKGGCERHSMSEHYDMLLHKAIDSLPDGFHLLIYGPSWIRQLADAILRHAHIKASRAGGNVQLNIHGEDKKDSCYCTFSAVKCPCGDFATYELGIKGGARMTTIVNYRYLQMERHRSRLHEVLHGVGPTAGFTHALAMEPHEPCFFEGTCPPPSKTDDVPSVAHGVYGCGWSETLWQTLRNRFDRAAIVHIVPWHVPAHYPVGGDESDSSVPRATPVLRTRRLIEDVHEACEAVVHPGEETTRPATASPGVSGAHQCNVICRDKHDLSTCHNGSPTMVAYEALKRL